MKAIVLCIAGSLLLGAVRAQGPSLADLRAAVEAHPDSASYHEHYIEAFRKSIPGSNFSNYDSVMNLLTPQYEQWMTRFPKVAVVPFALGHAFANAESPRAKPYLQKAVALDPTMAEALMDLSIDAERWGDFNASLDYLKRARDAAPTNPDYAFYYASAMEDRDPAQYQELSQAVVKDFPTSERGAQALYWLAFRSTDEKEKVSIYEELKDKFPPAKFGWSASGMSEYFDLLLTKEPSQALSLARSMSGVGDDDYSKKEWANNLVIAEKMTGAQKAMDEHRSSDAMAMLADIKVSKWSGARESVNLFKAAVMDAAGNTQAACDSLEVFYAKEPSEGTHDAMVRYAAKLGKDAAWVDQGVLSLRASSATTAPVFKLYAYMSGDSVSLADYRGKVVLLTFWFPGCGPCRGEFPHFQTVLNKYKGQDIAYVGINVVLDQDPYVKSFMQSSGYGFTPLRDGDGWAAKAYHARGCPTNFLIDRDGKIVFSNFMIQNEKAQQMLDLMIGSLLMQKA